MKALLLALFISISAHALPIDEIKIEGEGVSTDQVQTLKNISGFMPGDEYERNRNDRAVEKITEFYQNKGYPAVKINTDFDKNDKTGKRDLVYKITLGDVQKISNVDLIWKEGILPSELRQKIMQSIDFKPNEAFDRDRLKEMRRSIEVALLSQNYIDSKVIDIKTESKENKTFQVSFTLDLGQQVLFSVSGNVFFARSELAEVIEEQRKVGLGRDYMSVLMNRLTNFYVDHGYRNVEITPYTFEPHGKEQRKVVFEINEGDKIRIHRTVFEGAEVFSSDELEQIFYDNAADRIQARIYNESMVEAASRSMVEELKNRGFLAAKVIAIKTEDYSDTEVNVRIFISEGVQTLIQSIDFAGNKVITSSDLQRILSLRESQPLSLAKLEDGLESVKREYRNLGYLDVKITNENSGQLVNYSERNQYAYISIEIDEGTQWFYSGLKIFGTEKTKPGVIEREVVLQIDEPVSEKKLLETEDRLRRLGIFSSVTMELIPDEKEPQKYRKLKVSVQEAIPGNMGVGVGFRNDLGIRLFGELTYANLFGQNHALVFNLSGNRRLSTFRFIEFSAQVVYIWPWFILGETTFRPNLSAERRQYRQFDAETFALSASFDRMLIPSAKVSGSLTYAIEQIKQFNAVDAQQNQQIRIGSITPSLRVDLRDHPLTPRSGYFASTSFEYANSFLGSQEKPIPVNYGRFQVRNDFYFNFIPRLVWYTSFRGGWLKNFASDTSNPSFSIPLIKQFALGGINSMRGFLEQEINVQAVDKNQRVLDFMTYVNYRTQFDFYATQNLSMGPFMDAGNLNVADFSLGHLQYGTGVGLRYMTPVGPVNFDWGFKLFPKTGAEANVFYFSLGVN